MADQLSLLASTRPYKPADGPTGGQHLRVLHALYNEGERGLTGEECAERASIRNASTATQRMLELADPDRYDPPLAVKSVTRERAWASGVMGFVFRVTPAGRKHVEETK